MMLVEKWRLVRSAPVLVNRWFKLLRNQYRLPSGESIDDYYVLERPSFVLVVAQAERELVLVRQYRPATDEVYLALPAGYVDPGESVEQAARRELAEETGYQAQACRLIGELHPLPGYIRSTAFVVYCAVDAPAGERLEPAEILEVARLDWEQVRAAIVGGVIREMQAVAALLLTREVLAGGPAT
jgi:8-oxo-dGTP pyrophosphatase MutT (NUDIX family)